ncbi:prepilin-type N-terminal cleavage/methylation domain-containing protein [Salmonella enterica]|nr:prepilin-type N-terminal cleavage/methylation domain-containing protein [Salmonella enterica]
MRKSSTFSVFHSAYGKVKNEKQSGFTLIESMVVMIIGVMVLAGAATGINKLFVANNVSTEAQNIQTIAANMKMVASAEGGFADISDTATAESLKIFPANMKQDGAGNVKNVWGGAVNVKGAADSYELVYNSVPAEECVQIASKLRTAGWNKLDVGGTEIKAGTPLSDIQKACGDSGNKVFTFTGH